MKDNHVGAVMVSTWFLYFKIKNNGNRTLSEIKIVIYFKNSRNQFIAEDRFILSDNVQYFSLF